MEKIMEKPSLFFSFLPSPSPLLFSSSDIILIANYVETGIVNGRSSTEKHTSIFTFIKTIFGFVLAGTPTKKKASRHFPLFFGSLAPNEGEKSFVPSSSSSHKCRDDSKGKQFCRDK